MRTVATDESLKMSRSVDWEIPGEIQPKPGDCAFDLDRALSADLGIGLRVGAGDRAIMAAEGGRRHAIAARVVARQEFAGYWEYVLDRAIFTAPAHPFWGGAGLIGADGRLIGIGSLHVQHASGRELRRDVNMVVPIDLLPPILDDMLTYGRPNRPARPWLGLIATEVEDAIVVAGLSERGPAGKTGLKPGDRIVAVRDEPVSSLASFWRRVWAGGPQWPPGRPRFGMLRLRGEPPVEFLAASIAGGRRGLIVAFALARRAEEAQMEMIIVPPPGTD